MDRKWKQLDACTGGRSDGRRGTTNTLNKQANIAHADWDVSSPRKIGTLYGVLNDGRETKHRKRRFNRSECLWSSIALIRPFVGIKWGQGEVNFRLHAKYENTTGASALMFLCKHGENKVTMKWKLLDWEHFHVTCFLDNKVSFYWTITYHSFYFITESNVFLIFAQCRSDKIFTYR